MNPYYEIVKKDIRAAQEEMIRLSLAGFKDRLKLYQEALDEVLAESKPVVEAVVEVKEEVVDAPKKRRVKKDNK